MDLSKWLADLRTVFSAVWAYRPKQSAGLNFAPSLATDWSVPIRKFIQAFEDARANKPRPASPPMTGAERSALIAKAEVLLPHVKAWLAAHPGDLTAIDDLLDALTAAGLTWASALKAGVDAAPDLIAEANEWLPALKFLLGEFAPPPVAAPDLTDPDAGAIGARGQV